VVEINRSMNTQGEESQTLEHKTSLAETKQIVETVSAFSNAEGGIILIGVSDTGKEREGG